MEIYHREGFHQPEKTVPALLSPKFEEIGGNGSLLAELKKKILGAYCGSKDVNIGTMLDSGFGKHIIVVTARRYINDLESYWLSKNIRFVKYKSTEDVYGLTETNYVYKLYV